MDEKKIILMSKLAIEEKCSIVKDKRITSYFSEDYIYINNFKTRLLVMIVTVMIIFIFTFFKIQIGGELPTTIEEVVLEYILPYGSVLIGTLVVYSALSSQVYRKRYNAALNRMNSYKQNLKALEAYESSTQEEGDRK
ncbi:MAG: hypothetical protein RR448_08565 [Niameybacter sp.]|uniref:hypothetical protein n=1 Tax=Niameybacter sp. TaxID=2033640 RepID=UPI002FC9A757